MSDLPSPSSPTPALTPPVEVEARETPHCRRGAYRGRDYDTSQCHACWRRLNPEQAAKERGRRGKVYPPAVPPSLPRGVPGEKIRESGVPSLVPSSLVDPANRLPRASNAVEPCKRLGTPTGETVECPSCRGLVRVKLYACETYGTCTLGKVVKGVACCAGGACPGYVAPDPTPADPTHAYDLIRSEPPLPLEPTKSVPLPAPVPRPRRLRWSYGVTTCPLRRENGLLARTLASLRLAGFDTPRVFADGVRAEDAMRWERDLNLEVVGRYPTIFTQGNWSLALSELFIREPTADRYAIFQDDFVTYRGLRTYLEGCYYPDGSDDPRNAWTWDGSIPAIALENNTPYRHEYRRGKPRPRGYLNLYTMPSNDSLIPKHGGGAREGNGLTPPRPIEGWFLANQYGRGAVALVFDSYTVRALLTSRHFIERPMAVGPGKGGRPAGQVKVDGGILEALKKCEPRIWEYCHYPSLVQHTGEVSSMGSNPQPLSRSFREESWDVSTLLQSTAAPS